jgi:hypothetical protein
LEEEVGAYLLVDDEAGAATEAGEDAEEEE